LTQRALVTGGAGFIGSHLVERLLQEGFEVTVMDKLVAQVHGRSGAPSYLDPRARFLKGDVADRGLARQALAETDVVFHLAARVGVAQSMYEIARYTRDNVWATARFLEAVVQQRSCIRRLVVASSMSIYGEGSYSCPQCGPIVPGLRPKSQLEEGRWEIRCPRCGCGASACPTAEDKPLLPTSVYAVNKRDQEELCLAVGRAYAIPTVALRLFNVYGPRQSLDNPYTGVAAIFSSRLLNDRPPVVFEDGHQTRDFVHVSDVVEAMFLAAHCDGACYEVLNVGTGRPVSVLEVARLLARHLRRSEEPLVVGKFREGDIRHCYADATKVREILGFNPRVPFEEGVGDLCQWARGEQPTDKTDQALAELALRGLVDWDTHQR
jgi:dTDP-L-rhamnose 4-epimerase